MSHRFKVAIVMTLLITTAAGAQNVEERKPSRKRIGLALSGGGALGLAHIGVLRYFEEHRIPVDAIAGTSMGGLVGGLYSTGLSAQRLQEIALQASWDDLLRATPKYEDLPIAEKQSWIRSGGSATLRLRRNLSLPVGLNSGQPLALLLSRYTAAYSELRSFDDLPTRFRCVATDLGSGDAYVLNRGSLPLALRATMAVPGIFTPVRWENTLLVDGGILDNIPVTTVRSMDADVVIAVSLVPAHQKPEELNSLNGVLKQLVSVVIEANERRSLKQADMNIAVPLQRFASTDYVAAEKIIAAGYKAAESMREQLALYEMNERDWAAYVRERQERVKQIPNKGKVLAVHAEQPYVETAAREEIQRKLPGNVDRADLEKTLAGITSATSLPSAYYGWQNSPQDAGYVISLQSRLEGGVFLRPALLMDASGGEPTRASLRLSSVTFFKDAYKERMLTELTVGYDPSLRFEYYAPIGPKPHFLAPGLMIQRTASPSYVAIIPDTVRDRFAGTLYSGLGTWRFVQWRAGITGGYDRVHGTVITNGIASGSTPFLNTETSLLYDKQDSGTLPTQGARVEAKAGYSLRDHAYPYLTARYSHFFPSRVALRPFVLSDIATSFGRNLAYHDQFTAGGLSDLPAYRYQEFRANTFGAVGAGLTIPLSRIKFANLQPVLATWHELGRFDLGPRGWQTHQSTSMGLFGKTPLGTAGLVLSATEAGAVRLRFVFGRP